MKFYYIPESYQEVLYLIVLVTYNIFVVLQKAEENAEGGESALGPDGEVRDCHPFHCVLLNGVRARYILFFLTLLFILSKNSNTLA